MVICIANIQTNPYNKKTKRNKLCKIKCCEPHCRFNNLVVLVVVVGEKSAKNGCFEWHFIVFSQKIQLDL